MAKEIVSFEHFDPDIEFGVIDAAGHSVRPRKKPGRKPNPPSPAQRKAQNRAAQRAFRERKRYEMREAQLTAKKSIQARNQAFRQIKALKRRIEELEYETNYLKGYTLTLKLACEANHVDVPKFWDSGATDEMGAEEMTYSMTKGIPQQLEFFLDKDLNIINFDQLQHNIASGDIEDPPTLIISPSNSSLNPDSSISSICSDTEHHASENSATTANQIEDTYSLYQFDEAYLKELLGENINYNDCTTTNMTGISTQNYFSGEHHLNNGLSFSSVFPQGHFDELENSVIFNEEIDERMIDPKTGINRSITEWTPSEANSCTESSREKRVYPPMTAHEALKIVKSIKHLDDDARVLFTPTELQRTVRHDPRIDAIPGPANRDLMILYQDYYNANELFDFLSEKSMFLGGELGNLDSWFVQPEFFKKYWFILPCHRRQRIDNAVEVMAFVNKKLIELLAKRKEMYIERDQYLDYFPAPTKEEKQDVDNNSLLQKEDSQIFDNMSLESREEEDEKKGEIHSDVFQENIEDEVIMKDASAIQPLKLIPSNLPLSRFQQTINF